jgi:hypothetical protein
VIEVSDGNTFVLEAKNRDLAASVRRVTLGFRVSENASGERSQQLMVVAIETAAGDVTRYRFYDGSTLKSFPEDHFKPGKASPGELP